MKKAGLWVPEAWSGPPVTLQSGNDTSAPDLKGPHSRVRQRPFTLLLCLRGTSTAVENEGAQEAQFGWRK